MTETNFIIKQVYELDSKFRCKTRFLTNENDSIHYAYQLFFKRNYFILPTLGKTMKIVLFLLMAIATPLFLGPVMVYGQGLNNNTANNSDSQIGGLSSESVDLANSNATNQIINSTSNQNVSGGLSSESVRDSMY